MNSKKSGQSGLFCWGSISHFLRSPAAPQSPQPYILLHHVIHRRRHHRPLRRPTRHRPSRDTSRRSSQSSLPAYRVDDHGPSLSDSDQQQDPPHLLHSALGRFREKSESKLDLGQRTGGLLRQQCSNRTNRHLHIPRRTEGDDARVQIHSHLRSTLQRHQVFAETRSTPGFRGVRINYSLDI